MFLQNTIKYLIVCLLAVVNFTGLYVVDSLHSNTNDDNAPQEPPSTTLVQEYPVEHINKLYNTYNTLFVVQTTLPAVSDQLSIVHDQAYRLVSHGVVFTHGDISWLPNLAAQAGWPKDTWNKLGQIILRESGGCPNRRGGDVVDSSCEITSVARWNHRSDTGLLQINGVNYNMNRNKWAAVCLQLSICTQEPLFDPLNNLKAGKVLYDLSGWEPWNACNWNPKQCKNKKSK